MLKVNYNGKSTKKTWKYKKVAGIPLREKKL